MCASEDDYVCAHNLLCVLKADRRTYRICLDTRGLNAAELRLATLRVCPSPTTYSLELQIHHFPKISRKYVTVTSQLHPAFSGLKLLQITSFFQGARQTCFKACLPSLVMFGARIAAHFHFLHKNLTFHNFGKSKL